jgi:hypothetical protein
MDHDEAEVTAGEAIAGPIRRDVLNSGDSTLIRVIRQIPDESLARFLMMAERARGEA